jgi:2-oxoglutarate ferredoxin oxidoreductase subunit alpha
MTTKAQVELDKVVIRFAGDSGDGMQLTGSQFTFTSALIGNDLATFPDFPAEIRAPKGTMAGVSGFQVQIGKVDIYTPGDVADVLVAMNPAALRANLPWIKEGGNIILDVDAFDKRSIEKAGFTLNPLEDESLHPYHIIPAPITNMVKTALKEVSLDTKSVLRCRNMFALGITYWLFDRNMDQTLEFIEKAFGKKDPALVEGNQKALKAGYFYAETVEALPSRYKVPAAKYPKGIYRHISGNVATAWGLMAAREKTGKILFYGSYPITPASDILHELSKHKHMGVITLQAEDEIAAVCSAIGASYSGNIGITASAGPGIALKGEAIGLAIMTELPLVVIDVQRGGPSTGLPTKTEQGDFNIALHGRNGDSPAIVIAASTPSDCFHYAFMAVKLSIEHMTPVILLSDCYLANGAEPWKIPKMADLPEINAPMAVPDESDFQPYTRDPEKLSRQWAVPGMHGLEHRIGGLEKEDGSGNVSYDPANHEHMIRLRAEKVARVANFIPELEAIGADAGGLLLVGWGGTYGSLFTACKELRREGHNVSHLQFNYLSPLPRNTKEVLSRYDRILVCELNTGQFADHLRAKFPGLNIHQFNKIEGLPFAVGDLKNAALKHIS